MDIALSVENLHAEIRGLHILQGVNFEAKMGEITVILGRNGVGKTTLFKTIIGIIKPKEGAIKLFGEDVTGLPPHKITRKGISYVPSERAIFSELTVEENLKIAYRGPKERFERNLNKIFNIFPDLEKLYSLKAGNLSGGQQKMLSIACALINDNKVLLLDEPSEGLSPKILKDLYILIGQLRRYTTIVIVEQNFNAVKGVGDYCYIMDKGKIVYQDTLQNLEKRKDVLRSYLGVSF